MARQRWEGGYIRTEADGAAVYMLERQVGGQRFHLSTRCSRLSAALRQLARFEADPLAYRPEGSGGAQGRPLVITAELVADYLRHSETIRGNSRKYIRETACRLADWEEDLAGKDLRRVTLRDDLLPALSRRGGRKARIVTLKALYAWLRKEAHLLTSAADPTLDLPVPQARPEKMERRKAVPWETVQAVFPHLKAPARDALQLLAGTGWHWSELERFVRDASSAIVAPPGRIDDRHGRRILAVLVTRHKSRSLTRTPLVEELHVQAATRLRKAGRLPRRVNAQLRRAVEAANRKRSARRQLQAFTIGVMRHSVATWAIELGATAQEAAEYLGHESKRTTLRFYADVSLPTATIPTRALQLDQGRP